mgnify:CR=1 FL=1
MAKKTEVTVEEKLRALYDLQLIDSRIDEIRSVRGELPLEVEDLEDEVAGLNKRLEKMTSDLESIDFEIKEKKNKIEESNSSIKKYSEQQKNVRNNREFNALSKEVEFQELEIELAEKHIKEFKAQIIVIHHPTAIAPGYTPVMHAHTAQVAATVTEFLQKINPATGAVEEENPKFLKAGDSAIVKIRPVRPTCIETFQEFPEMGRFALRDMGATIAAGIVKEITEEYKP